MIGAGHNALIAACYLARAGLDVEVFERADYPGGAAASTTAFPGYTIDRGASLHILLRSTGILEELELHRFGLRYVDADPWAFAPFGDQAITFSRDLAATCGSIANVCGRADATAYARFVADWAPRGRTLATAFAAPPNAFALSRALYQLGRLTARRAGELARDMLCPADVILDEYFSDERLKTALAWLTAQSGPPSHYPATAPALGWIAALHAEPPGRAIGGSGALIEALTRRLRSDGGTIRVGSRIDKIILNADRRASAVLSETGDRVQGRVILAGCHIVETLRLLGADELARKVRVGAGMGMAVRLGTRQLPGYPAATPGAHHGMQLLAASRAELVAAHAAMLTGEPPQRPACLVLTPSALDPSLAPPGRHTVTIWAQWHPSTPRGSDWSAIAEREALKCVGMVEAAAPGFAASVEHVLVQTPADLERDLGLVGGNLMHVEMSLESMFGLRPLPGWARYQTPYPGLYLTGASTHPGGGVSGASGRSAARAVLAELAPRGWPMRLARRPSPWRSPTRC